MHLVRVPSGLDTSHWAVASYITLQATAATTGASRPTTTLGPGVRSGHTLATLGAHAAANKALLANTHVATVTVCPCTSSVVSFGVTVMARLMPSGVPGSHGSSSKCSFGSQICEAKVMVTRRHIPGAADSHSCQVGKDASVLEDQIIRDSCVAQLRLARNESLRAGSKYFGKPFFVGCGLHKPHAFVTI